MCLLPLVLSLDTTEKMGVLPFLSQNRWGTRQELMVRQYYCAEGTGASWALDRLSGIMLWTSDYIINPSLKVISRAFCGS